MYRRIRELREDMDLTQSQIATYLHCSQRVYSNYERGERDIPTVVLILLADRYAVSADYLLGRTDCRINPNCNAQRTLLTVGVSARPLP